MSSSTSTPARARAAALVLGSLGAAALAAWVPLLDRDQGSFVLRNGNWTVGSVPRPLVFAAAAAFALGVVASLVSLARDPRVRAAVSFSFDAARRRPIAALAVLALFALGSFDVYEFVYDPDPFKKKLGLRPWMLREDAQSWLVLACCVMAGLALSALLPDAAAFSRRVEAWHAALARRKDKRWWLAAFAVPVVCSAAMSRLALEGLPHFSDSCTYLFQARVLGQGKLFVAAPPSIDLFKGAWFVLEKDGRMFGKYPIGWPALLAPFDALGAGFLANAVLAGALAVLTGLLARQAARRRVAVLAALLVALSPWVWFNGSTFSSHVAAAASVTAFLWLFLKTANQPRGVTALAAGLALGYALNVRPFDAAAFALPPALLCAAWIFRDPKRWLPLALLIAAGATVGVLVYMGVNQQTTGDPLKSPYTMEGRWEGDWDARPIALLGRLAYSVAELNGRVPGWGLGAATVAALGAFIAARQGAASRRALWLIAASTGCFVLGCLPMAGLVNVWWGPRWLTPAVPLLAILAAEAFAAALRWAKQDPSRDTAPRPHRAAAAQLALCLLAAGVLLAGPLRYAAQFAQHRLMPPHNVSSEAHRRALAQGIDHAIIAMPPIGVRAPMDTRAGLVFMNLPLADNRIIYVRAVKDWPTKALAAFPGRSLYELKPNDKAPGGFEIVAVETGD